MLNTIWSWKLKEELTKAEWASSSTNSMATEINSGSLYESFFRVLIVLLAKSQLG